MCPNVVMCALLHIVSTKFKFRHNLLLAVLAYLAKYNAHQNFLLYGMWCPCIMLSIPKAIALLIILIKAYINLQGSCLVHSCA